MSLAASGPVAEQIICAIDCYPHSFFTIAWVVIGLALALVTRRWWAVPLAAAAAILVLLVVEIAWRISVWGEGPFDYFNRIFIGMGFWRSYATTHFLSFLAIISFFFAIKRTLIWTVAGRAGLALRLTSGFAAVGVLAAVGLLTTFAIVPDVLPRRAVERAMELSGNAPPRCRPESADLVKDLPPFRALQAKNTQGIVITPPPSYRDLPSIYTTQMGGYEHLLTRPEHIRVSDPQRYSPHNAVALVVIISETGDVVAAEPVAGPQQFYARAVDIVSRWKFIPFTRDGKATPVKLVRAAVRIEGPERWLPLPVAFPRIGDWDSTVVRFSESTYEHRLSVEIRADGSVTFIGEDGAAVQGTHCATIPRQSIVALINEIQRANFFSMRPWYNSVGRSVSVGVALDDHVREVRTRFGESEEAPEQFWHVVDAILQSVHADRWIRGDEYTGPTLVAERWDFTRRDETNMSLLANVAWRGNAEAVRDLLRLGAPVRTRSVIVRDPFFQKSRPTALENAADRGARDIVELLLLANVPWSREALSGAFVSALEYGDLALADALLARGANPNGHGMRGMTALMAAARAGVPETVAAVLSSGVDVHAVDEIPLTALHWAAAADYPREVDSVRADRRRVIDLLVDAGARVDARGHFGWTPLISNWMGLEEVTAALIAHGADVNAQDEDGRTPLMTNGSPWAIQMLLSAGADPYIRDKEGRNALEVAQADVFAGEVAAVLERWMASHPAPDSNDRRDHVQLQPVAPPASGAPAPEEVSQEDMEIVTHEGWSPRTHLVLEILVFTLVVTITLMLLAFGIAALARRSLADWR